MAGQSGYPKELPHPCGYKTILAFDADEERAFHKTAQAFRLEHQAAHQAALRGETIKPVVDVPAVDAKK
jgi:hypothetical protein